MGKFSMIDVDIISHILDKQKSQGRFLIIYRLKEKSTILLGIHTNNFFKNFTKIAGVCIAHQVANGINIFVWLL